MDTPTTPPPASTTPSPTPSPATERRTQRFSIWRFVIGGVIILLGLQWLAASFGWSWSWSVDLWKFWPVLIILLGLSFMTRGRSTSLAVSLLIGLAMLLLASSFFFGATGTRELHTQSLTVEQREAVTAATIDLKLGAAKLRIDGNATALTGGSFRSNVADLTTNDVLDGTTQHVTYTMSATNGWWFRNFTNDVNLALTNTLPVTVNVDTGATDLQADFSDVQLAAATIHAGASSIDLTLGNTLDTSTVEIDSGASSIDIRLPSDVGVALSLDTGLSGKTLPKFSEQSKGEYRSDNYDTATKHISLTIKAGASSITMHWQ